MTPSHLNKLFAVSALCLGALAAAPAHAARFRFAHGNADGGVTSGAVAAHAGEAASGVRGHRFVSDGQGNAGFTSGAAYKDAHGGVFKRAGQTTHSADGSLSGSSRGPSPSTNQTLRPRASGTTRMSENKIAASKPKRRTGCKVTSVANSGVKQRSRKPPAFARTARYSGR